MAYRALYNKYRPQTFEEVIGQQGIVRTLKNAIASGKIAQAYLFTGPRGTGKTTMARLFAKALNCEQGLGMQCNECSNCKAITEGNHPDVIEIDAASNNGVEQVRDLINKVRYAPIRGKYKVYIIDEVHMMSQAAWNALLKTIEEPPERVIFVMATTEPFKIPATILSRVQRFDFAKISDKGLTDNIKHVLNEEGIDYEERAVEEIVSLADGGMRDALSILEQVLAYSGNSLSEADVLVLFGLTSNTQKINILRLIKQGDVSALLTKFNDFVTGGIDIKRLNSNLLEILKDSLIYIRTNDEKLLSSLSKQEAEEVASFMNPEEINKIISVLLKTQAEFRTVSNIRSLFELSLIQLASEPLEKEEVVVQQAPAIAPSRPSAAPVASPAPVQEAVIPAPRVEEVQEVRRVVAPEPKPEPPQQTQLSIEIDDSKDSNLIDDGDVYSLDDDTLISIMVLGGNYSEERRELKKRWSELDALKGHPKVGKLASLLASGSPVCLCQEALLINFNYPLPAKTCNIKANQSAIEGMVEQMIGKRVFVYAFDRKSFTRIYNLYTSLEQIRKLPNKKEIKLNLPKGE